MNSKRKILALLLALTLAASFLTACDFGGKVDPSEIIGVAEGKLDGSVYTVNVSTVFATEDDDVKNAVASLEPTEITYTVNGESFMVAMSSVVGGFNIDKSYTVVDNTLYHKSSASLGEQTVTVKEKASIGNPERAMLISKAGVGASIEYNDFENAKAEKTENGYTITCTDIKDDAFAGLTTILSANFKGTNATVNVSDVGYSIEIINGAFSKTTLTCSYKVTLNGTEYDLSMTVSSVYDFMNAPAIKIPTDADSYASTTYDKIIK